MKQLPDWDQIVQPLNYATTHTKINSLLRCNSWKKTKTGLECETALNGKLKIFNEDQPKIWFPTAEIVERAGLLDRQSLR